MLSLRTMAKIRASLFVAPVALATAAHGRRTGMVVAASLPSSWALEIVDTGVDVAILLATSILIEKIILQERELQVLEGRLPICSFCKRIRDEEGHWRQLEGYISARSSAQFSHTFCPECGLKHYPGLEE